MDWWRDLFSSRSWQRLQLSWEDADDADADAAQVERVLRLAPGSRVLDVPCGTGRIARRLRADGHRVVGIDATGRFLQEAARSDVQVICADMRRTVVRPGTFDAAFCLWGSFGYFDDAGNHAQARALADALAPGGRCLIDTIAADTILPGFEPHASWDLGDTHVEEERRYDEATERIETIWSFTWAGEREQRATSVRLYSLAQLTDLLTEVGFGSFQAFDGELQPFGTSSMRLWLVATVPD